MKQRSAAAAVASLLIFGSAGAARAQAAAALILRQLLWEEGVWVNASQLNNTATQQLLSESPPGRNCRRWMTALNQGWSGSGARGT